MGEARARIGFTEDPASVGMTVRRTHHPRYSDRSMA